MKLDINFISRASNNKARWVVAGALLIAVLAQISQAISQAKAIEELTLAEAATNELLVSETERQLAAPVLNKAESATQHAIARTFAMPWSDILTVIGQVPAQGIQLKDISLTAMPVSMVISGNGSDATSVEKYRLALAQKRPINRAQLTSLQHDATSNQWQFTLQLTWSGQ